MQTDRGLAGAGAALDDKTAVDRPADHAVLLGLDRGDDVAHRTGAGGTDFGQHRIGDATRAHRVRVIEMIVLVGDDPIVLEREPAPQLQPERVLDGGPVEGRGDIGAPVDHDRLALFAFDVAPPDVKRSTGSVSMRPKTFARAGRRGRRLASADVLNELVGELIRRRRHEQRA